MTQGIYEIVNWQDGKASTYIGSSMNIEKRWEYHRSDLRAKRHCNAHLQYAWNKWGEDAFVLSVLEEVESDMLLITEQEYLDDYFDRGHCYNIAVTAGPAGPLSEEHKRKLSMAHKGKALSREHRRNISKGLRGRKVTEVTRRKISRSLTGRKRKKHTEETKRKMSEAQKGNQNAQKHKRTVKLHHAAPLALDSSLTLEEQNG